MTQASMTKYCGRALTSFHQQRIVLHIFVVPYYYYIFIWDTLPYTQAVIRVMGWVKNKLIAPSNISNAWSATSILEVCSHYGNLCAIVNHDVLVQYLKTNCHWGVLYLDDPYLRWDTLVGRCMWVAWGTCCCTWVAQRKRPSSRSMCSRSSHWCSASRHLRS